MRVGLDVGSTTIKCVVLDDRNNLIYHTYERHYSHIVEKSAELLRRVAERCGREAVFAISGSAGMGMAESVKAPFVQEVFATRVAANRLAPGTDVIIELGGEDAKILFLTNGMEVRMNGSCAGGTGAFIDQMATLLKMGAEEMDKAAQTAEKTYTIAARCGVFAKSDIQPLINQGAKSADIAKSIYQAVVNQTISGLACGKPIRGCVAFLGGPLHFLPELKKAFIRTLKLTPETTVDPENSHLFAAMGAALESGDAEAVSMDGLIDRLEKGVEMAFERGKNLYFLDEHADLRRSHENPDVKALYDNYFEQPLSHKSHMLLHTDHNKWQMPPSPQRNRNGYVINPNAKLQG